ncbi:MAG: hypothetical protein P4L84_11030 [Isosphaeraceae bacterium]|nr:hypothetical protein [Isosphaeraceae bacterium]
MSDANNTTAADPNATNAPGTAPTPEPTPAEGRPASTAPVPATPPAPRFEWGPDLPTAYQPPPIPGVKDDAHVVFVSFDAATGEAHFEVSAHDPSHENAPAAMHLVLYAPGAAIHAHAADAYAAGSGGDHPMASVDVAITDHTQSTNVVLPRPAASKANIAYTAKTVLEFHDAPTA